MESTFSLYSLLYMCFSAAVTFLIVVTIINFIYILATKKQLKKPKRIYVIMPILLLILAAAGFILNMGWIRFVITLFPLAPLHAVLFLFTSYYSASAASQNRSIRYFTLINYISFPLFYMLLPDGGDTGGLYMFFSLIKNETLLDIACLVAPLFFIVSFIFSIIQIILTFKYKRSAKKDSQAE